MKRAIPIAVLLLLLAAIARAWPAGPADPGDYPKVTFAQGGTAFQVGANGYSYRPAGQDELRSSDFGICFAAGSTTAQNEARLVVPADGAAVTFAVRFDGEVSGVQVLRWPLTACGTDSPLDSAQRVPYEPTRRGGRFTAEPGCLYSVYITWQDCFIEYPFQALSEDVPQ